MTTDLDLILPGSVAEIGGIRIGTLAPDKQFPAVKLDHFILTTPDRDAKGVFVPDTDLMDALRDYRDKGTGKLREIPVIFPSNTIADVLQLRYEWWPGKSRIGAVSNNLVRGDFQIAKGDVGVTFYAHPRTGEPLAEPETRAWDDAMLEWTEPADAAKPVDKRRGLLKLSTTLSVQIASTAARFGGLYRFRSKGWHTANQLLGCLQHIKHNLTFGLLRGPVFKLVVRPKTCRPKGVVSTVYVVHVECVTSDLLAIRQAARENALYERDNLRLVGEIEREVKVLAARPPAEDAEEERAEPPKAIEAPKPSPEAERTELLRKAIVAAATADEVKVTWLAAVAEEKAGKITRAQLESLIPDKDAAKARVTPRPAPQPASEPAAKPAPEQQQTAPAEPPKAADAPQEQAEPEQQPAAEPQRAGPQIVRTIAQLVHMAGTTWPDWRAEHAEALGFTAKLPGDLTAEQAQAVYALLKEQAKGGAKAETAGAGAGA